MTQLIKRLKAAVWRRLKKGMKWLDWKFIRLSHRSGLLSSVYFAIFNRSFDREHKAVLAGRLAHEMSLSPDGNTSSLLRRGIHRLEKGILSRPRRDLFALGYIRQTFNFYEMSVNN